jgi:DNA-binding transcriptional ArsR family regulator
MSTIVLNMRTTIEFSDPLEALFGKTRRLILALLYSHADEAYYLRKILRITGVSLGAGQRELKRLTEAGILVRSLSEGRVYFQANPACPIYAELKSMFMGKF